MPRVSIITPTYNGERFIGTAIDSVLAQSLEDFELIIVDDGSTDGTPTLLKGFAKRDSRIRISTRPSPSGGPTIPKNIALSLVASPYVCFLDHDDYYHPDKLKLMCSGLDEHPDWVAAFHDIQLVAADGKPHAGTYLSNANFLAAASNCLRPLADSWFDCGTDFYFFMSLRYAAMHTQSVMIAPQRLLQDPVSFRARFRGSDDTDLWLRIGMQGGVGYLDRVLAFYRQHGSNLSLDTVAMLSNAVAVHEENYLRAKQFMTSMQLSKYRQRISSFQSNLGYQLNLKGEYPAAKTAYLNSLRFGDFYRPIRGIAKAVVMQFLKKFEADARRKRSP